MKRKLRFLAAAMLGFAFLAGCASTNPGTNVQKHPTVVSGLAYRSNTTELGSNEPNNRGIAVQTVSYQTASHVAGSSEDSESAAVTPEQSLSNAVVTVASSVVVPNEGPSTDSVPEEGIPNNSSIPINLPTALAMIGGQHPVVGFAQWRVQEAYAQLDRAKVMWLPSIQSGFNYRRRDGNYQDVQGAIVDVDLNSMNYGLGAGAVAAGSPTRPGIVAQFHLADAIFLPKAVEKTAWANGHSASAVINQQLLHGGIAYIDLLEAYQDAEIVAAAASRTSDLVDITENFAEAGEGLKSDADRTAAELSLLQTRQLAVRERQLVASTRLARVLSIPMSSSILPQDSVVVPLEMMPQIPDEPSLISTGLSARPELKESQALVAAACEAYKREKYAPFVPSVLLGFSSTSFGGGLGNNAENFGGRYDVDALMVWETRNLGFGEGAARRQRNAQVQQATFAKLRIMDQVAQEVAEANIQVGIRKQQIELAQTAISRARDSYQRNLDRIRDGKGLPIEVLQAIQALEASERAYLKAVADYNRSQLQLQWALGWPVNTLPLSASAPSVN
ncbi:MAG: TolC family protein [Pirellula sp.]